MLSKERSLEDSGLRYLPKTDQVKKTTSPNQEIFPLTTTVNQKDHLEIGGCDIEVLVEQFGSPLYILDELTQRTACRAYKESFEKYYSGDSFVIFASKAWSCTTVCTIVDSEGLGFDVVSGGELFTTLAAGVAPEKIYFHGNNKSIEELKYAVESGCKIIVDNWLELENLTNITAAIGDNAVEILLRLTPGIECHTHEYIQTGHIDSKFGFDPTQIEEVFKFVSQQKSLNCVGLHAHIGSQIFELQPHLDLPEVLAKWLVTAQEYGLSVKTINVGGGLGIRYVESDDPPSIEEWVKTVATSVETACKKHGLSLPQLIAEPGRSLIGSSCITAYQVGGTKVVPGIRNYISVNGGMSDNPRPITYESLYSCVVGNRMSDPCTEKVTVAGKHCESGDVVIKDVALPKTEANDILVVAATGAYNYSMASNYNRIGRPAAILVNQGEANLFIERETYQNLLERDLIPGRLVNS